MNIWTHPKHHLPGKRPLRLLPNTRAGLEIIVHRFMKGLTQRLNCLPMKANAIADTC